MVVEWLKFRVFPGSLDKFITEDREIWTDTLSQYPGFLSKEIWLNPAHADEVILVIHWQSMEQWQAIPLHILEETQAQFAQAMGEDDYQFLEAREYSSIRLFLGNNDQ